MCERVVLLLFRCSVAWGLEAALWHQIGVGSQLVDTLVDGVEFLLVSVYFGPQVLHLICLMPLRVPCADLYLLLQQLHLVG